MPEGRDPVSEQVGGSSEGLGRLVSDAEAVWAARAKAAGGANARPSWRAFEDAFPTFYQFSNRP